MVLIHYTAMESAETALARLCDPAAEVSAHYLIREDGKIWQLVAEERRAWHAGVGQWGSTTDINSRSIGIELANPAALSGFPPFPEPQMATLEGLLREVLARWQIAPQRVLGHSDTAPGRKVDPGPKFDWNRLAKAGLAVWPEPIECGAEPCWESFIAAARRVGYGLPPEGRYALLDALRLRFRPWARGYPLQGEDSVILDALPSADG